MGRHWRFRLHRWFRRHILVGGMSVLVVLCLLTGPRQKNQRDESAPSPSPPHVPQSSHPPPIDTFDNDKVEYKVTRIDNAVESVISTGTPVHVSLVRGTNDAVSKPLPVPHTDPVTALHILGYSRILFVHIGKAGGETIKSILRAGCEAMLNEKRRQKCFHSLPLSKLSDAVQTYLHCFKMHPSQRKRYFQHHDAFLFSVRHPVDRAISWFHYVSPQSCLAGQSKLSPSCTAARLLHSDPTGVVAQFFTCFATVHDWATALATMDESNRLTYVGTTDDCRALAHSTASGQLDTKTAPTMTHMVANYQYYLQQTIMKKQPLSSTPTGILVVRMTHLWQDLQTIDRLLNGTGDFGILYGSAYTHGSELYNANHTTTTTMVSMSDTTEVTSIQRLCCALHSELLVYRTLIESAVNLLEEEKQTTVQATVERCGWDSWHIMASICL